MPVKKATPVKKTAPVKKAAAPKKVVAVKKAAPKKAAAVKKAPIKKTAKGDTYECQVCGLAVTVDETCGCIGVCDIICCKKSMKAKPAKAKKAKK
jgi:hypothetical protein